MTLQILLVEDDAQVSAGIAAGLGLYGFTVVVVASAKQANAMINASVFDVCVLDLGLPDRDGIALLAEWRQRGITLPILVLTARDSIAHKVKGLQTGADDYLLKPFDLEELKARLQALTRRQAGWTMDRFVHGDLSFLDSTGQVWLSDKLVELSRRELALLRALLNRPEQILTMAQLLDHIYGLEQEIGSTVLKVHIHNLRKKLGTDIVQTVRGIGYRLGKASS